jgi:FHA domain
MNVSENVCPVCKHKNELEAVVCGHCGATLEDPFLDPGAKTKTTDMTALTPEQIRDWVMDRTAVPDGGIAVYVEGASNPAYVDFEREFVVGRKVGTTSEGMLDLSPWGAYHLGLSRRHALVRRTEHGYEVLDLGSVNGTWLNDERLIPHKSYPLASGSHLRLGSMRLFVLYHHPLESP